MIQIFEQYTLQIMVHYGLGKIVCKTFAKIRFPCSDYSICGKCYNRCSFRKVFLVYLFKSLNARHSRRHLVKETFGQMSDVDINNVYSDIGAAVEALKSGKVDAVAVAKGNGDAIIANAPNDIAFSGFEFDVDPIYENNVCLIQKGNTALLEKVNAALAKAKEAGYYKVWYEASQIYSSIKTADELGYDENGVKITETAN